MTELPLLLLRWEALLSALFDRCAKFPKLARFTFTQRIEGLGLDILRQLTRARFATGRTRSAALLEADLLLAELRALLRIAHTRHLLDHRGYELLSRELDECGRMLGGWRRHHEQSSA